MTSFDSLSAVEEVLADLGSRGYARRLGRRPGQKEDRYEQTLGASAPEAGAGAAAAGYAPPVAGRSPSPATAENGDDQPDGNAFGRDPVEERLARLEAEIASLHGELAALRSSLGG